MYFENPMFKPEDNWVMVWAGRLNRDELDDYLNEPGVGDDEPISKFSEDLGRWYDHDFIWYEGLMEQTTIEELCQTNEYNPPIS